MKLKWILSTAAIIALGIAWYLLPLDEWMKVLTSKVDSLGAWGYLLFALIYVVGTVLLFPGAPLTIAGGVVFGWWGFPIALASATLGAALAFIVGRYIAHDKVKKMLEKNPKFKAIGQAMHEEAWKVIALMRLSPLVPFNLQNYFFGVTEITFRSYLVATFFGIIPGCAMYIYIGVIGNAASDSESASTLRWILLAAGLLATIAVTVLVGRKAKEKLEQKS